jgi:cell division septum initiation protein DivIVA
MNTNADEYVDPSSTMGGDARPRGKARGSDGPQAAARLLEITARETEQWRSEAESEAVAIVAGARDEAARRVGAAREGAERLVAAAREESARISNEARIEAARVRDETAKARKRHDEEVARLQQIATEHRERLRQHLTVMLGQVDSLGESGQ